MANYKSPEVIRDTTISFRVRQEDKDRLQQLVRRGNYKSLSALMEEMVQEYLLKNQPNDLLGTNC